MSILPDYKILFESAPGLYLILKPDPNYTIVAVTDAYLKATLTKRDEIIGHGLFEIFPDNPNDLQSAGTSNLRTSLQNVVKNRVLDLMAIQKYDVPRSKADGGGFEEKYWSPTNTPVLNDTGEVTFILHQVEDVTEFMQLKREEISASQLTEELKSQTGQMESEIYRKSHELKEANKNLKDINNELESFSYSVSHDLRAPLRGILGFSKILLEEYGNIFKPESEAYLHRIINAAQRMGLLIDALLDLSRLTRKEIKNETVSFTEIAKEIMDELQKNEPSRNITIVIAANMLVKGDLILLRTVLENLISNAWKFTAKKEEQKIEFGIINNKEKLVYFIKDNGAGFNMQYSEKLFQTFQRLHSEKEFKGTGVGLATVKRIIHRHNGRIWAESEVNKGTAFYFTLQE